MVSEEAWSPQNSDTSRPFAKPESGRIVVKVIHDLGDEVMKDSGWTIRAEVIAMSDEPTPD